MITKPSMGVLNLKGGEKKFQLSRHAPSQELGHFIKHFWIIRWDLTNPYLQDVIPNPCVNMVIGKNKTGIYGVPKYKYSQLLEGKGCVFGVKFRPGAFYPFFRKSVSMLTNRSIKIADIFNTDDQFIEDLISSQHSEEGMIAVAEELIHSNLPKWDERITSVNQMIDQIIKDREITKVNDICQRFNINKRKLQRLFNQYVGVSPKWVIKLYRLQDAAEKIDHGQNHHWSQLALELGYYDQAHFIKDFKSVIGKTPDKYVRHNI